MYDIQHCFICRPSDSTVSEDAGIEPRTVATTALTVRRSNQSARSHPHSARSHPHSARSHPLRYWDLFALRHQNLPGPGTRLFLTLFSILASRQKQNLDSYVTEELFGGQGMEAIKNIISCVRQVRRKEYITGRSKAFSLFVILSSLFRIQNFRRGTKKSLV